ncbi:MAG TPA: hypothetical protein VFJ96_14630 [Gemmatimonadaceae bacterium]|nr:hypothetical protein [Gemmatimonadaceae bacterium]
MERIEDMTAAAVAVPQALRALITTARFAEWIAPDVTFTPLTRAETLGPGDRFRVSVMGMSFEYLVEAVSEREVIFAFSGAWSGRERWSFIADGSDTLIRRVYEVTDGSPATALLWRTVGRLLVLAHLKLELARFRTTVEHNPGPRAEIEPSSPARPVRPAPESSSHPASESASTFPIDEG